MKVRVEYVVDYETDNFYDEISEYAGDHPVTKAMIREFCIDRAFNLTAVDPAGDVIVSYIPTDYQVM